MGDCKDMSGGYPPYPPGATRKPPAPKPIFNICLLVILPVIASLTIMAMLVTYWLVWKMCNEVSWIDKTRSDSGELDFPIVLQSETEGYCYEVFHILDTAEYIAFHVPTERMNEIVHIEPSYYPVSYWYGEYRVMDLSQDYPVLYSYHYYSSDEHLSCMTQVKVYDFSAYKGHSQDVFGRGPGIMLFLLWFAELFIASLLAIPDIIAGFIILGINLKRKR